MNKRVTPQTTCVALAAFACMASACGGGKSDTPEGALVKDGRFEPSLQGAWRILGQGTLLEITDGTLAEFAEAKTLCYPDPDATQTADSVQIANLTFRGNPEGAHARVDVFEAPNTPSDFTMERLDRIPPNCRLQPAPTAANTFQAMWEMMDLDYGFFAERHIDWAARYAALAPKAALAADDDALQAVLIEAVHDFSDDHVQLHRIEDGDASVVFNARNTPTTRMLQQAFQNQTDFDDPRQFEKAWMASIRSQVAQRLVSSSGPVLNGALIWGKLPGNVGYIGIARMVAYGDNITSLDDSTAVQDLTLVGSQMDQIIAALADTQAMIVDVALNIGGRDLVSAEIAGRFTDQRRLAFTKTLRRPQGQLPQNRYIEPKGAQQYLKPVYLLASDRTVSAGETFTLMMRQLPQVRQIGQATAGSLSDILGKPLPGNFRISIPNEIDRAPDGALFEARGIPPQRPLQIFDPASLDTLFTGHDAAITAILNMISAGS